MAFLKDVEDFLEGWVEGWFVKRFKGPLQPQEVARKAVQAMLKNKKTGINKIYVPNFYEIALSQEDWKQFEPIHQAFSAEVGEVLSTKAKERNLTLLGNAKVHLRVEPSLPQGLVNITSQFVEPVKEEAFVESRKEHFENTLTFGKHDITRTLSGGGWIIRVIQGPDEGKQFRLGKTKLILGRKPENEIALNDSNISRNHAQIDYKSGQYILIDLDSTNGTYLNGQRITTGKITPGDRITIGKTEMLVEEG